MRRGGSIRGGARDGRVRTGRAAVRPMPNLSTAHRRERHGLVDEQWQQHRREYRHRQRAAPDPVLVQLSVTPSLPSRTRPLFTPMVGNICTAMCLPCFVEALATVPRWGFGSHFAVKSHPDVDVTRM